MADKSCLKCRESIALRVLYLEVGTGVKQGLANLDGFAAARASM